MPVAAVGVHGFRGGPMVPIFPQNLRLLSCDLVATALENQTT